MAQGKSVGFYAGGEFYKFFYAGQQDEAAKAFQQETGWHMIWGSDYQGLNGDTWVVYRAAEDLPKWLQEYAREQEEIEGARRQNEPGKSLDGTNGSFEVEALVSFEEGQDAPLKVVLVGDDLVRMKQDVVSAVVRECAAAGHLTGEVHVDFTVTQDGEWLDHDEDWFDLSALSTWICSYKDVLMELDDDVVDNLTYVLVPTAWLKGFLREEGVVDFDEWLCEYTADSTVDIAWLAMKEKMIFACDDEKVAAAIGVSVGEYPRTPLEAALEKATREAELREGQAPSGKGQGVIEPELN